MNSLGSQSCKIGNGGIGVQAHKLLLQGSILGVLSQLLSLVLFHLAYSLPCTNLLLKLVLLEGAASGLGFKVEQIADHHEEAEQQRVALDQLLEGRKWVKGLVHVLQQQHPDMGSHLPF